MLKILIWQVSDDTQFKDLALQILEYQHDGLKIVGEASNDDIAKVDVRRDYEILAIGAKKIGMSKVTQDARRLNLPEEKLLGDWIVTIPGFTLEKYRELQRSYLSIIAINCLGGLMSHTLGLPFLSPFGTHGVNDVDFIKFLNNPRMYMEKTLIYNGESFNNEKTYKFPTAKLGDISMTMVHYKTFEEFLAIWERRKLRINWYNLFVTTYTEDKKILEQFDALPYAKKVCFVPFKSDLDSAWYINPAIKKEEPFWRITHLFALGDPFYYDVFDMLLYGKKTPLIEM